jgi:hypothetical protein
LAAYIVSVAHSFQQTPTYSTLAGHGLGEFVFASPKAAVQSARPLPVPPSQGRGANPSRGEAQGGEATSAVPPSQGRGSNPTASEAVLKLVYDFFEANNNENVDTFLQMFTTEPSYFSWGPTPLPKIKKDKQYFFSRWPDVKYTPIGEPQVINKGSNRFQVNIKFDFYVRSIQRCEGKHGESSFELEVENIRGSWKIASIKEDVYYRNKSFKAC